MKRSAQTPKARPSPPALHDAETRYQIGGLRLMIYTMSGCGEKHSNTGREHTAVHGEPPSAASGTTLFPLSFIATKGDFSQLLPLYSTVQYRVLRMDNTPNFGRRELLPGLIDWWYNRCICVGFPSNTVLLHSTRLHAAMHAYILQSSKDQISGRPVNLYGLSKSL
ncbi:hypothetical protein An02g06200 [Aspergillus niger]|uniref:Uncharacterized protein n=2 Tax=Aspergillus niger TaxID=5061 RepID=A2QD87_ASPNC|nr:hypothetical protein An02g06200 [Aspergillus niger]CAK37669.1 hypothetical protein An02g06200 [Aspergillus niger]